MALDVADLELRLSGGVAETNPDNSLGGIRADERVLAQTATGLSSITGVTMDDATGNPLGAGTLSYTNTGDLLDWQANGEGSPGTAIDVSVDGNYGIPSLNGGYLMVTVVAASLPGSDQSDTITVANIANEIYDDVTPTESFDGHTDYRCLYVYNTHATDTAYGVTIWIEDQASGADTIAIGSDPAGVGNGTSTGVATTIGNEITAPGGVGFSSPASQPAGIVLGNFDALEGAAFWIRRTVPAVTVTKDLNDFSNIGISAYI